MHQRPLLADKPLPLCLSPDSGQQSAADELVRWVEEHRDTLVELVQEHGAVLFRGFRLATAPEFERVVRAFSPQLQRYVEGQSQREKICGNIYTSTSYPARQTVTLHNELSYVRTPPRHLFFFCATPPSELGETPIVDCRLVLAKLSPGTLDRFRGRGIRYVKNMHAGASFGFGKSWQEHFETADRAVVEDHLRSQDVAFEWLAKDVLRTAQARPAIATHPDTGDTIWFNQASLWHVSNLGKYAAQLISLHGEENLATNAYFENGEPIADELLDEVRDVTWNEASFFPWQRGDLLFVDNHLVAHGRNRFSGERSILVALS